MLSKRPQNWTEIIGECGAPKIVMMGSDITPFSASAYGSKYLKLIDDDSEPEFDDLIKEIER